jgi:hypothetical protein
MHAALVWGMASALHGGVAQDGDGTSPTIGLCFGAVVVGNGILGVDSAAPAADGFANSVTGHRRTYCISNSPFDFFVHLKIAPELPLGKHSESPTGIS